MSQIFLPQKSIWGRLAFPFLLGLSLLHAVACILVSIIDEADNPATASLIAVSLAVTIMHYFLYLHGFLPPRLFSSTCALMLAVWGGAMGFNIYDPDTGMREDTLAIVALCSLGGGLQIVGIIFAFFIEEPPNGRDSVQEEFLLRQLSVRNSQRWARAKSGSRSGSREREDMANALEQVDVEDARESMELFDWYPVGTKELMKSRFST
ncbi:hypothetical protein RUND412_004767 [Rhizina undulata]